MTDVLNVKELKSAELLSLPLVTGRRHTLANGLEMIIQEDRSAPVASVQVWVETGSIHEGKHLGAGISHLLEHMLFKGTTTRGASEFAQGIQNAGGYINAYTSFDRTVYYIDIPAKGVSVAIDLLADAILNSTLPVEAFVKEQEVIRREFAMGNDDPDRVSGQRLFGAAFREHPYRHPVIGYLDVFNEVSRDEVMAYYKARYVPNNLFFVVVGDVDFEVVRGQLTEIFEKQPRVALAPVYIPEEPPQIGRRESHTEFATELTRLHLAWHVPAAWHGDIPALDVVALVLGGGRSSRLYKRLREELGLVHGVDAWCYAPGQAGLFGVDAVMDPVNRVRVEGEIERMIGELRKGGVTEEELAKARKMALGQQLRGRTTMSGSAGGLGGDWMLARNLDFSRDYLLAIQAVSGEDIRRVMGSYFGERNLTVVSVNPVGSLGVGREEATKVEAGEVQKFQLANGLRLLVREDSRLPLVSSYLTFKAGMLSETVENQGINSLLAKVILKGTTTRTAEQIADEIEELGGGIACGAGGNTLGISVGVMRPDLEVGIELMADVVMRSTFPEAAIAREKEAQLAGIKAEDEQVTVLARRLLNTHLFGDHPYGLRSSGTVETVGNLTRADLMEFRDRHFVGKNGVLAIFGDVKAEEVLRLVERAFGEMASGEMALVNPPHPVALEESREVERIEEKEQAVLMVGFSGVDIYSEDAVALEMIEEACSDLGSRLFLRIRDEMGLAYFVGSSQLIGLVRGSFTFYLGTAPEKLEEVKVALHEEIAKLAAAGLTAEEFARSREKSLGQMEFRIQSNSALASQAAVSELYGLGYDHHLRERAEIEALTLERLNSVARRYLERASITAIVRPMGVTSEGII